MDLPVIALDLIRDFTITKTENGFYLEMDAKNGPRAFIANNLEEVSEILKHFYKD